MNKNIKYLIAAILLISSIPIAHGQSERDQAVCSILSAFAPIAISLKDSGNSKEQIFNTLKDMFDSSVVPESAGRLFNNQYYMDFSDHMLNHIAETIHNIDTETIRDDQLTELSLLFASACLRVI